jgi:hypothetical protein
MATTALISDATLCCLMDAAPVLLLLRFDAVGCLEGLLADEEDRDE